MSSAGATAVLPIGAASKQHGRHLPMDTDRVQVEWLASELCRQHPVLVWPTVTYGYYPAFVDYPGSTSLPEDVFLGWLLALGREIQRAGARRIMLLNSGISTVRAVDHVAITLGTETPAQAVHIYSGTRYRQAETAVLSQSSGGHADEAETSIMLALAPERVRMEQAGDHGHAMVRGPYNRTAPDHPNYSPDGASGSPQRATAEKGRVLLAAMVGDMLAEYELFPKR